MPKAQKVKSALASPIEPFPVVRVPCAVVRVQPGVFRVRMPSPFALEPIKLWWGETPSRLSSLCTRGQLGRETGADGLYRCARV